MGCRFALEKRYKRVFASSSPSSSLRVTGVKSKNYGFGKILLQMAGGKFGSHNETKLTPLHTFLEQLNEDLTPVKKKK